MREAQPSERRATHTRRVPPLCTILYVRACVRAADSAAATVRHAAIASRMQQCLVCRQLRTVCRQLRCAVYRVVYRAMVFRICRGGGGGRGLRGDEAVYALLELRVVRSQAVACVAEFANALLCQRAL